MSKMSTVLPKRKTAEVNIRKISMSIVLKTRTRKSYIVYTHPSTKPSIQLTAHMHARMHTSRKHTHTRATSDWAISLHFE